MDLGAFWVGQIPAQPLTMTVYDENGSPKNLSAYTTFTLNILGPRNNVVDTSTGTLNVVNANSGRLSYQWPSTSLFDRQGQYTFQLMLSGPAVKDFTNTATVYVREAGKVLR